MTPFPSLVCPSCRRPLAEMANDRLRCSDDGFEVTRDGGIWHFLSTKQASGVDPFLDDYRRLRRDEGWTVGAAAYYRALPFHDATGRHTEIWRIRAASYELLCRHVPPEGGKRNVPPEGGKRNVPPEGGKRNNLTAGRQRVADLGAGNCWLSWRLAEAGHSVAAVDLSNDPADGLGTAVAYPEVRFLRLQASFDRVPFAEGELDVAVFNGSLHYSTDLRATLAEARRLVSPGGQIVIMDSPVYRRARSGERMLQERQEDWQDRYGAGFGAFPAEGFLTRRRLRRLGAALDIEWRFYPLPLGWRWHLAPLAALALGRREPARFPLIVGRVAGSP